MPYWPQTISKYEVEIRDACLSKNKLICLLQFFKKTNFRFLKKVVDEIPFVLIPNKDKSAHKHLRIFQQTSFLFLQKVDRQDPKLLHSLAALFPIWTILLSKFYLVKKFCQHLKYYTTTNIAAMLCNNVKSYLLQNQNVENNNRACLDRDVCDCFIMIFLNCKNEKQRLQ